MLAFNEMMRRIRPQQEVKQIRDEIKVRKIEQLSGNPVMVCANDIAKKDARIRLCRISG